jgi:D-alanyl-D-alanine carboxypeptidase
MFLYKTFAGRRVARLLCAALAVIFTLSWTGCAADEDAPAVPHEESSQIPAPLAGQELDIPAGDGQLPPPLGGVSAKAAVLMEAVSGEVVFAQNPDLRLPMASTTKIMTALVALEEMPPETVITVPPETVGVEGSSIYLTAGETLTLEDLLYALLLESANDAAETIAVAVAGSVADFASLMNRKAAALGLENTCFQNPHGLDADGHYTTARELALLTRAALQDPVFREICGTRRKTIPLHGTEGVRLLLNHNKLLGSYEGCIGVKTGYTRKTGRCLVSAAERDGVTLIAVTLNAPDDWRDHAAMLDYGFGIYEAVELCAAGGYAVPLWVVSGMREYVMVENTAALTLPLRRDHGPIRVAVELPPFVYAPVQAGALTGQLVFYEERRGGERKRLALLPLTAAYGAEAIPKRTGLWARIRQIIEK